MTPCGGSASRVGSRCGEQAQTQQPRAMPSARTRSASSRVQASRVEASRVQASRVQASRVQARLLTPSAVSATLPSLFHVHRTSMRYTASLPTSSISQGAGWPLLSTMPMEAHRLLVAQARRHRWYSPLCSWEAIASSCCCCRFTLARTKVQQANASAAVLNKHPAHPSINRPTQLLADLHGEARLEAAVEQHSIAVGGSALRLGQRVGRVGQAGRSLHGSAGRLVKAVHWSWGRPWGQTVGRVKQAAGSQHRQAGRQASQPFHPISSPGSRHRHGPEPTGALQQGREAGGPGEQERQC